MKYTLILLLLCNMVAAQDLSKYLLDYRTTGNANYRTEKIILDAYVFDKLTTDLSEFYIDSMPKIRQKAFYLTYKKANEETFENRVEAVLILINGCNDKSSAVVGQNLSFLQAYSPTEFDSLARSVFRELLIKRQMSHYKQLVMLAGYVNVGQDIMKKRLLQEEISADRQWAYSLALARMGDVDKSNYVLGRIKQMPLSNNTVEYLIPELIYTRTKGAIDYCVDIINSNEKACFSPNPDKPEDILCGYRIMELLAPIVIDFPFGIDATGSIDIDDYEKALQTLRIWFDEHANYQLNRDIF